jgi:hypothetical protein
MKSAKILAFLLAVAIGPLALPGLCMASEFEAETYPVEVLGEDVSNHVLGVEDKLSVECSTATFKGELDIWTETEEVSPTYSGCTAFGISATVATNGCTFLLRAGEELAEPGDFEGTIDVNCPTGKKIVITAGTCEVQVGSQEKVSKVEYDNDTEASPDKITLSTALTKLKYNKTKDGFACPLTGAGEKEDGTYNGTSTIWAEEEEGGGGGGGKKGVAVAKPPNTKLCEKLPNPTCAKFFGANTKIEGKRLPASPKFLFSLRATKTTKDAAKNAIQCEESKFEAKTEAEAGVPLKEIAMTFTNDCTTTKGTSCTVKMENSAPKGFIRWTGFMAFGGQLTVNTFDVLLECKGELKCEYVTGPVTMDFSGGAAATLAVADWMNSTPTAGEENCWTYATFTGIWELTPAGIWLVKV